MASESKILNVNKEKTIDGSVEDCWKELTDFSKETAYWPNIRNINVLNDKGSTIEREAVVGPHAFGAKTKQTLTLEHPGSIHVEFEGDGLKGFRDIILAETDGGKTIIKVSWDLQLGNVPGFVFNIIRSQISKTTDNALNKINEFLLETRSRRGV